MHAPPLFLEQLIINCGLKIIHAHVCSAVGLGWLIWPLLWNLTNKIFVSWHQQGPVGRNTSQGLNGLIGTCFFIGGGFVHVHFFILSQSGPELTFWQYAIKVTMIRAIIYPLCWVCPWKYIKNVKFSYVNKNRESVDGQPLSWNHHHSVGQEVFFNLLLSSNQMFVVVSKTNMQDY